MRFDNKTVIPNATGLHVIVPRKFSKQHANEFIISHPPLHFGVSSIPLYRGATAWNSPSMHCPCLVALQQIEKHLLQSKAMYYFVENDWTQFVSIRFYNRWNPGIPLAMESKRGSWTTICLPTAADLWISVFVRFELLIQISITGL